MNIWERLTGEWGVVLAASAYVYLRHTDKPPLRRALVVAVSGILAVNVAPELEPHLSWVGPRTALLLVLVSIWWLLDVVSSIAAERDEIAKLIIRRLGGKK